jgi:predicted aspartyl protease
MSRDSLGQFFDHGHFLMIGQRCYETYRQKSAIPAGNRVAHARMPPMRSQTLLRPPEECRPLAYHPCKEPLLQFNRAAPEEIALRNSALMPHGVSRRRFLTIGASTVTFASIISRAQSLLPPRESRSSDTSTAPQDTVPLAASNDTANHLTVAVQIDGHGPYRFVVDTGADRSVLAADVAAELNLAHGQSVLMEGVVREVAADTVLVDELSIGSIKCRHGVVPILPRSMLQADGYLGLDALDGHRVIFDFKNHTLQVIAPRSRLGAILIRPNETRIRTSGSSGHLRAVDCIVDGVAATAFIDTGAEVSAANSMLLSALARGGPAIYRARAIPLTDVTGGEISGNVAIVDKIQLQDVQFTNCPLVIADFRIFDVWGLHHQPALLIGMNFLRQFSKVSIDYGLKELRFDLVNLVQTWSD